MKENQNLDSFYEFSISMEKRVYEANFFVERVA